jgi:hypothetical protein
MARVEIASQAWGTLFTKDVNPAITTVQVMPSAVATLKNLDGTNATIWTAVTGGTSNTSALSSDSIGVLGQSSAARFVEEGTYSLTVASTTRRVEATRGEYGAPANARTAGADNTGTVDATTAIQGLLDTVTHTIVPPGDYRIDGTVTVNSGKTLEIMPGANLKRLAAASSTAPIVNVTGIDARLMGRGTIQTEKTSPTGIVLIGPPVQTVTTTVDQWRLGPLKMIGRAAPTSADIGLNVWSSQAASGDGGSGAGANYNGLADPGMWISNVGEGLRLGSLCNAHTFGAINFSQIATICYRLKGGAGGVQECSFFGGFTHTAYSGSNITIIKGERAMFNQFYGIQAEPLAVAGTVPWNLDANSTYNKIFGYFNIPGTHAGVDSGTFNFFMDGLFLKVPKLVITTDSLNVKVKAGAPTDGDFFSPLVAGTVAWDDTNKKLYVKDSGGVWRASAAFT